MRCYAETAVREYCQAKAVGSHGLCADHRDGEIRRVRRRLADIEPDAWWYLDDARKHKRFGNGRGNVISQARAARGFNHQVIRLRRKLRELEATP